MLHPFLASERDALPTLFASPALIFQPPSQALSPDGPAVPSGRSPAQVVGARTQQAQHKPQTLHNRATGSSTAPAPSMALVELGGQELPSHRQCHPWALLGIGQDLLAGPAWTQRDDGAGRAVWLPPGGIAGAPQVQLSTPKLLGSGGFPRRHWMNFCKIINHTSYIFKSACDREAETATQEDSGQVASV